MILTIFGYPKTGKTLLFNLLTDQDEETSKFSTSSDKYHTATIDVPDKRLDQLVDYLNLPPVYAKIQYLDTGMISFEETKGPLFLGLLRQADGLVHISRGFEDEEIVHPKGSIDPIRDIRNMEEELKSVDFISIEKRIEKLQLDRKKIKSKEIEEELDLMGKLKNFLETGKPLREYDFNPHEEQMIRGFTFLSQKPLINIINTDENSYLRYSGESRQPANNTTTIIFCGKIEKELLELEEEERKMFQEEYGLKEYMYIKENLLLTSYKLMDLVSFFTVGKKETKAWTIKKDSSAFIAAGKIHSDIQQGFIKAEVVNWKDFLDSEGFSGAKEMGLLKLEGKEYIIQDGEVIYFRFSK